MTATNSNCSDRRNEHGAALLLTLILMLVLSLLTVSLYELLQASTQITGNHRLELRTTYIADAGVEAAINELRVDPSWVDAGGVFIDVAFGDGTYTVNILNNDFSLDPTIFREADIISTATVFSFQRKIEAHVAIAIIGYVDTVPRYSVSTISWKLAAP